MVAGRAIKTWPMVPCSTDGCTHACRWKDCHEERTVIREEGGVYGNGEGGISYVDYCCAHCMAVEWGLSPEAALVRIRDEKAAHQEGAQG